MANDASYFSITTAITTAITDGLPILEAQTRQFSVTGNYGTGGYVEDGLCHPGSTLFDRLRKDRWVDYSTRAVSIDASLFSPATRLITTVQLLYEVWIPLRNH